MRTQQFFNPTFNGNEYTILLKYSCSEPSMLLEFWKDHTLQRLPITFCSYKTAFWRVISPKKTGPIKHVSVKPIHTVKYGEYKGICRILRRFSVDRYGSFVYSMSLTCKTDSHRSMGCCAANSCTPPSVTRTSKRTLLEDLYFHVLTLGRHESYIDRSWVLSACRVVHGKSNCIDMARTVDAPTAFILDCSMTAVPTSSNTCGICYFFALGLLELQSYQFLWNVWLFFTADGVTGTVRKYFFPR